MYNSTITEYKDDKDKKLKSGTENDKDSIIDEPPKEHIPAVQPLIWRNIIAIALIHIVALYLFISQCRNAKILTWIFEILYGQIPGFGVTAGAHRLWAHKSYKAKLPLRIALACAYCTAGQTHLTKWIRVHRTHHRFTDTSADPHNANRGFFFSHVGWLMMKHHPAVKDYGKNVDISDLAEDPVIRFFDKYYSPLMITLCFILPTMIPVYLWNENWMIAIGGTLFRYMWSLNATFSVNSFAHLWGNRPYNRTLMAAENKIVSMFAMGEGWHNYHHCFPWDYKTAELGLYRFNLATAFIDLMAWLGLAYDLKTATPELIDRLRANKGDGLTSLTGQKTGQISQNVQLLSKENKNTKKIN